MRCHGVGNRPLGRRESWGKNALPSSDIATYGTNFMDLTFETSPQKLGQTWLLTMLPSLLCWLP